MNRDSGAIELFFSIGAVINKGIENSKQPFHTNIRIYWIH
jgi:hypothetical protein